MTVWLVRIWTHKNADEKAHTLSRRSKNVKKRTKTYEKRILCKFTLTWEGRLAVLVRWSFFHPRFVLGPAFPKRRMNMKQKSLTVADFFLQWNHSENGDGNEALPSEHFVLHFDSSCSNFNFRLVAFFKISMNQHATKQYKSMPFF